MLNKLIAILAAVIVGGLMSATLVQTARLGKATDRAVAASAQAEEYRRSLSTLQAAREAEKKDAEKAALVLKRRAATAEVIAKQAQKESEALREALKVNRDWADVPLPAGVRDALQAKP